MPTTHNPRRGSLQFWPRKRAKKEVARVRSWNTTDLGIAGFRGYKVGMTQITYLEQRKSSPLQKEIVTQAATIIECPPVKIFSVRFYADAYGGKKVITETINPQLPKHIKKHIPKLTKTPSLPESLQNVSEIRVILATQPHLTGIGKKKPDFFEVALAGTVEEQLQYAKDHFDKDISVKDIFKQGDLIDIHAVTKGKGFQGTVKRFGVKILSHKAEKKKRGKANLGAWTPSKVSYTVPQPGKMGYHLRTDYNKLIFSLNDKEAASLLSHFKHYGVVKNDYIIVKGSITGPTKRGITFTKAIRPKKNMSYTVEEIK